MNPRNDQALLDAQFTCVNHADRAASPEGIRPGHPSGPHFCQECFIAEWNKGAQWADEHWADEPFDYGE